MEELGQGHHIKIGVSLGGDPQYKRAWGLEDGNVNLVVTHARELHHPGIGADLDEKLLSKLLGCRCSRDVAAIQAVILVCHRKRIDHDLHLVVVVGAALLVKRGLAHDSGKLVSAPRKLVAPVLVHAVEPFLELRPLKLEQGLIIQLVAVCLHVLHGNVALGVAVLGRRLLELPKGILEELGLDVVPHEADKQV